MNRFIFVTFLLGLAFMLNSCFKEDDKVEPYDRGDVVIKTIEMTQYYTYQVYFDLEQGKEISTNNKNDWDLGFESSEEGSHILLNTSAFMVAGNTGSKDFNQVQDTTGLKWKFDQSDGNLDSTAIGDWFSIVGNDTIYSNFVYIINRGYTDLGTLRGLKKIQFTSLKNDTYNFRFANMDGSDEHQFSVQKNSDANFVCFTFAGSGQQLAFEPPTDTYDLLFSQYTTLLYTNEGVPYPYLVTGVLSNRKNVEVALDTVNNFSSIEFSDAVGLDFSPVLDFIGYDWKDLVGDVNSGNVSYIIVPNRTYLIKNRKGFIYKLRFTGFYNNIGEKGYPTIEFKLL